MIPINIDLLFQILLVIFIINLTITGIFLLIRSLQIGLWNLFYLGIGSFLVVLGFIGNYLFNLGTVFEDFCVNTGFVFAAFYTKSTFYRNRKNYSNLLLILIIILGYIHFIISILTFTYPSIVIWYVEKLIDAFFTFLVFSWMGLSSYKALIRLKDQPIQPWIKFRYKILTLSSLILSIQAIPEIFMPYRTYYADTSVMINFIIFIITFSLALIYSFCHLVGWLMPKWLKNYLNREHLVLEEAKYSEQELMTLLRNQLSKNNE
ncbi:MAG: hypothetical protein EU539_02795 [Promethearchaeota archaeon]|nr:MAG: hypothetical protein EU539_02795 [Candidatus Lokiarchaeota archaeon]